VRSRKLGAVYWRGSRGPAELERILRFGLVGEWKLDPDQAKMAVEQQSFDGCRGRAGRAVS
jgi:hypothetical protein